MPNLRRERDMSPERISSKRRVKSPSPRSRSHTYSPSPQRDVSSRRYEREYDNGGDFDRGYDDKRRRSPISGGGGRVYGGGGRGYGGGGGGGGGGSRRFYDGRDNPTAGPVLGVFGMSLHTTERDLKSLFGKYGDVESVQIVYDRFSGRSRGFGFVYFTSSKDATRAKERMQDAVIDGMKVRVDYSVTRSGGPYRHVDRTPSRSPVAKRKRSMSRSRSR